MVKQSQTNKKVLRMEIWTNLIVISLNRFCGMSFFQSNLV